jgi:hypothetical protein
MTARELAALQGKRAHLVTAEGLEVEVDILDARQAYGRTDLLVSPKAGSGQAWVSDERVKIGRGKP